MPDDSQLPEIGEGDTNRSPEFYLSMGNTAHKDRVEGVRKTVREAFISLERVIDFVLPLSPDGFGGAAGTVTVAHKVKGQVPLVYVFFKSDTFNQPLPAVSYIGSFPETINNAIVNSKTFTVTGGVTTPVTRDEPLRAYVYKVI